MAEKKRNGLRMISLQNRKIDEKTRSVEFVASDESIDSYGTIIPVKNWVLDRFNKNGAIGYQHNLYWSSDPDDLIGTGTAWVEDDKLMVRIEFETKEINEKADKIYQKVLFGSIKGVSVGFSEMEGGEFKEIDGQQVYVFGRCELIEISVVNIPANANALKRYYEDQLKKLRNADEMPDNDDEDKPVTEPQQDPEPDDEDNKDPEQDSCKPKDDKDKKSLEEIEIARALLL